MNDNVRITVDLYQRSYPDEDLERLVEHLFSDDDILDRSNMRGHITTSMVVLSPDKQSVLLIKHRAYGIWVQPGGHYEPTPTAYNGHILIASALRELQEETGLEDVTLVSPIPIDIDIHPIGPRPEKGEGSHYHYDFGYLAIANTEAPLVTQVSEIDDAQWVPISQLDDPSFNDGVMKATSLSRVKRKIEELGIV